MRFIQLGDYHFNPDEIAAVRESPLDSEQTIVFTTGQSAVDEGFLVDQPIGEVLEAIDQHWLAGIDDALSSVDDETH